MVTICFVSSLDTLKIDFRIKFVLNIKPKLKSAKCYLENEKEKL